MAADAEAFGKADRLGGGGDPWVKPRDDEIKRRGGEIMPRDEEIKLRDGGIKPRDDEIKRRDDGMEMPHSQGSPA